MNESTERGKHLCRGREGEAGKGGGAAGGAEGRGREREKRVGTDVIIAEQTTIVVTICFQRAFFLVFPQIFSNFVHIVPTPARVSLHCYSAVQFRREKEAEMREKKEEKGKKERR
jgi:hypothetical protein